LRCLPKCPVGPSAQFPAPRRRIWPYASSAPWSAGWWTAPQAVFFHLLVGDAGAGQEACSVTPEHPERCRTMPLPSRSSNSSSSRLAGDAVVVADEVRREAASPVRRCTGAEGEPPKRLSVLFCHLIRPCPKITWMMWDTGPGPSFGSPRQGGLTVLPPGEPPTGGRVPPGVGSGSGGSITSAACGM